MECTLSDYVAFAQCLTFFFRNTFQFFLLKRLYFFASEERGRLLQTESSDDVTACNRWHVFRLEFQVLRHIPERHKLRPPETKMLKITAFVSPLFVKYVPKEIGKQWRAFHVFWDTMVTFYQMVINGLLLTSRNVCLSTLLQQYWDTNLHLHTYTCFIVKHNRVAAGLQTNHSPTSEQNHVSLHCLLTVNIFAWRFNW